MSTRRDRKKLRTFFEQGDRPDESQFSDLIESGFNQIDDDVHAVNQKIGIGTDQPDEKLDVDGKVKVREDLMIKGHVIGDKADKNPNEDTLYLANYAAIGLHGENKPAQAGDITLSANKANGASGKIVLNRFLGAGQGHAPGMIIDGDGKVGIDNNTPNADFQVGKDHISASLGEVAGAATGWGTSYLGFNAARKNNQWQVKSDTANNGGAVVFGNIFGGLNFATIPTQGSSNAQNLSDQQINNLTKMKIAPNGNVGIGVSGTPDNKLHIDNGVGKGANTGLKLSSGAGDKKILVSDSQGNASWMNLTSSGLAGTSLVPIGAIIMWSGKNAPAGWVLCDGNNGQPINGVTIPDLRGRFVVGYDSRDIDYRNPGDIGPANSSADYDLIDHGKKVRLKESTLPSHHHNLNKNNASTTLNGNHQHSLEELRHRDGLGVYMGLVKGDAASANSTYYDTDFAGNHTHGVEGRTENAGGNIPHENRPPFYVLAFIIKI